MYGTVFDIKEFSLHDGPGIRTTVFLKGCPLRCKWCHNPEGLSTAPQLMVKHNLCTHCDMCQKPCEHEECKPFSRCLHACPNGLISLAGTKMTPEELSEKILKNKDFFDMGGGVTFSGGEPTLQADFLIETAKHLGGVHKAVQTCGYCAEETFKAVVNAVDYVMLDIKIADCEKHKKYTERSNEIILKNFRYLKNSNKEYLIRTPLIPDITDTEENLTAIKALIGDSPWETLDYNTFAGAKYPMLDMEYPLKGR